MSLVALFGYGLAIYAAVGVCVALTFVTAGVHRVLAAPATFSPGARLLLLPGAFVLWPYVLARWLAARSRR